MTVPVQLDCAWRSDIGRVRRRNEDVVAVAPERGWAVLADGMGGYRGGDVAARIGVDTVIERLEVDTANVRTTAAAVDMLLAAVGEANAAIYRRGLLRPELAGMGSTLVAAIFLDGHLVCAHVGDSRLYCFSDGGLDCLTRDHTMLQEQVDAGVISAEDARLMPYRGMLTRGLGVGTWVEADVAVHALRPQGVYLICSDGLTDMLDDADIASELAGAGTLDEGAERLLALANARGGRDNISLILARAVG